MFLCSAFIPKAFYNRCPDLGTVPSGAVPRYFQVFARGSACPLPGTRGDIPTRTRIPYPAGVERFAQAAMAQPGKKTKTKPGLKRKDKKLLGISILSASY